MPRARTRAVAIVRARGTGDFLSLCTVRPRSVALVLLPDERERDEGGADAQPDERLPRETTGPARADRAARVARWTYDGEAGALVVHLPDDGPADADDEPRWLIVVSV